MPNQNCPLCESSANYEYRDLNRFKYFVCEKCSHFVMGISTEKELAGAPKDWLDSLSKQAYTLPEESLLFIAFSDNGELISEAKPKGNW
jgi:hypothetical protein